MFPWFHTGDAVDIYWIPLDPMVFIGLLIEPHGIPMVNHVDILETMGFPWFPIGDPVDIHWIPWDPMVTRGFPLVTMRFPWDIFVRVVISRLDKIAFIGFHESFHM